MAKGKGKRSNSKRSASRSASPIGALAAIPFVAIGRAAGLLARAAWANRSVTATVLAVAAIAAAWALGRPWLEQRAAAARTPEQLSVAIAIDPDDADRLRALGIDPRPMLERIALQTVDPDPFNRGALLAAATAIGDTGWFAGPVTLERSPRGTIDIRGTWRQPAVVVRTSGREVLVGYDGAPMMLPDGQAPSAALIRVVDPIAAPPATTDHATGERRLAWGEPWPGGDVQEAIELLAYIKHGHRSTNAQGDAVSHDGSAILARLDAVDLSAFDETPAGQLLLLSSKGGTIVWGAPIGEESAGEVPPQQKLANLRDILFNAEQWDQRGALIRVNLPTVFFDRSIGRNGG